VRTFHGEVITQQKTCLACHTEHRGALAQITASAMFNPHGEFIFLATGTGSCSACHQFGPTFGARPILLDNETVRRLLEKGDGAHRLGRMAGCLTCHSAGRYESEKSEETRK
jgi:cytochrome c551/c552